MSVAETTLDRYLNADTVTFADAAETWQDAVRAAARPLLKDGSIEERYVGAVIDAISAPSGTYMDLGFSIALAHARPENGVTRTGVSLLRLAEPVLLADDERHPVSLIFVLAAQNDDAHLSLMRALARLLSNKEARLALHEARTFEDVSAALALLDAEV